ncbi:helix-turn-helix domain-containing protein [Oscillibacter sp. MSJ-2]|uniref:Helix-turn-helix domain-containing protein n=1 Tax=Dysosmobacter acutus TaxID=2841504 RepID=A0ABS6F7E0_9FIRM|nr:helix-turn-helix transcriptional regulator [Dysosmobacter acutus]MBU5626194.1 helix-turn-helix domain-containing protein [Dysosmobacter acutus]
MDTNFVRERITQLRMRKGVSEYQMSYDLGHSRGYVNNISSGKSLPSLTELFAICEYFQITLVEFFDENISNPALLKNVVNELEQLSEKDLQLIQTIVEHLIQR